jgi:hypothetical protein
LADHQVEDQGSGASSTNRRTVEARSPITNGELAE